jgi:glycosyltransferase involved in cell wall biosynthesis
VRDGETGFLVPHGDVAAFAERLGRLAAAPSLVATMGMRARRFAETFTWDRAAQLTETHIREIVEAR